MPVESWIAVPADSPERSSSVPLASIPHREAYIRFHSQDLLDALLARAANRGIQAPELLSVAKSLPDRIRSRSRQDHDELIYNYRLLDPDRESKAGDPATERDRVNRVLDSMERLLESANYYRLTPLQVLAAVRTATQWGVRLRTRLGMFRHMRVYARGDLIGRRSKRVWYRFFRLKEFEIPTYEQLVVIFQPKPNRRLPPELNSHSLHLRMFKHVPHADIDMLIPNSGVRISWLDHGKIGIPTSWGFVMLASKLVKNIWLVTLVGALKVFTSAVLVMAVVLALTVSAIRGLLSFRSARNRYLLNVTQNLYYQTLSNNTGVLLRLIEEAKQQEICEAILAYAALLEPHHADGAATESVDDSCETVLAELGYRNVDFDVDDALRGLASMRLISITENGWMAHQTISE
jgi:hypothetical protein